MTALKRVAFLLTGGTISAFGRDQADLANYSDHAKWATGSDLLSRVPDVSGIAEVEHVPTPRHRAMTSDIPSLLMLCDDIRECLRTYDGVVVGYGTNALEEAAFCAHLVVGDSAKPVVFVGAMRPPSAMGTDADLNLLRAITVAASESAVGSGVLVVMNELILSGRSVSKRYTDRVDAFGAGDLGPVGFVDSDGRVTFHHQSHRDRSVEPRLASARGAGRVEIVVSYLGADGLLIDAAVAAGAVGIVSAGFGTGETTNAEFDALDRAATAGVIVCQASRVGAGPVNLSERQRQAGFISSHGLIAWKARILLALATSLTNSRLEIEGMFSSI